MWLLFSRPWGRLEPRSKTNEIRKARHKRSDARKQHDAVRPASVPLPSTIVCLLEINGAHIWLLSIGLFVLCAYFSILGLIMIKLSTLIRHNALSPPNSWLFFFLNQNFASLPSLPLLLFPLRVKLAVYLFIFLRRVFSMWKCFIGVCWNNEDKARLCGGRNAFLTRVDEWRLTFLSSRPFLLNGSTNFAVFITHYCLVPFLHFTLTQQHKARIMRLLKVKSSHIVGCFFFLFLSAFILTDVTTQINKFTVESDGINCIFTVCYWEPLY